MDRNQLKTMCLKTIDDNKNIIIGIGRKIYKEPELGYKEKKTTEAAYSFLKELGLEVEKNIAVTGCRARINRNINNPRIAVLGELDAISCKDHKDADENGIVHACGHNVQIASMLGTALALVKSGVMDYLDGNLDFMAVPAEEFIELEYRKKLMESGKISFFGGKQELIYRGIFDDVDMAMMVHVMDLGQNKMLLNMESNGFIGKQINFKGKASHAGSCPEEGINALNTAVLAINNINAIRETFRDEDWIRVHAIVTNGGDTVNVVPSEVKMEAYVRARNFEAIIDTNNKVNNAIGAAAMANGATAEVIDNFGYLPNVNEAGLIKIFRENLKYLGLENELSEDGKCTASFDIGDLSHIIPTIHPMVGGIRGNLHTGDFEIVDEDTAYILSVKIMALGIIDLLYDNAKNAKDIISNFKPKMTKDEYIEQLNKYSRKYLFTF